MSVLTLKQEKQTQTTTTSTATVTVLCEGEQDVAVSAQDPKTFGELLDELGIASRDGQLYLDGAPASRDAVVRPGSDAVVLPYIRGG